MMISDARSQTFASHPIYSHHILEFLSGRSFGSLEYRSRKLYRLEEMPLGANFLPWLKGRELARLDRTLSYFLLLNQVRRGSKKATAIQQIVAFIVQTPIRWRLRSSLFSFPWELWLSQISERIIRRRSLVTGQELPTTESANAC